MKTTFFLEKAVSKTQRIIGFRIHCMLKMVKEIKMDTDQLIVISIDTRAR